MEATKRLRRQPSGTTAAGIKRNLAPQGRSAEKQTGL